MPRRHAGRGIKLHRNYTVDEAARVMQVAEGTVRRWIKNGLPAITDRKPTLILGPDLIEFLDRRRGERRRLRLHEFFCFTCKEPRMPAFSAVEVHGDKSSSNLRAICGHCTGLMRKRFSWQSLDALRPLVEVTIKRADEDLGDSPEACSNDHLEKADQSHAQTQPKK